ncbi:MAG: protein kinase [Ignavibacterium sp.]|nr:MAG: protein kinase [Ignavibacterium sp.]
MIGTTISYYKILDKLGEGGMGVVYKAKDLKLKRDVAIKFLPRFDTINSEARERFKIEAQAAAALNHPNITTIHSIEDNQDDPFIVMEYIEGEDLKKRGKSELHSFKDINQIAIQICEGLLAAHEQGIIHRDIKSSNIMLTKKDQVKIMDFGLAKISSGTQVTKETQTLGTAAYMSPEQAQGEKVDNQTDIWSFGVVLYEMLTGKLPFPGDYEQAVIFSILNEDPKPVEKTSERQIPDNFKQVVMRCLQKSKEERYSSIEEVLTDLSLEKQQAPISTGIDYRIEFINQSSIDKEDSFTGREEQLKILYQKFKEIDTTNESTILIYGESGIGKSQLISKAQKEIDSLSINTIRGRCLYKEGGLPYHPFVSGIKNSISYVNENFIESLIQLSQNRGLNFNNRIPHIKSLLNFSNESVALLHKEQLWDSVVVMLNILSSEQPLIIILDDLQWADKTTLGLFSFIARNISNLPIMQIGIYRRGSAASDEIIDEEHIFESLRRLKIDGVACQIDLAGLNEEETTEYVNKLFGSDKVSQNLINKIYKHTDGLPLFISELVNLLKEKQLVYADGDVWKLKEDQQLQFVSKKIKDIIFQRVSGLDKELNEILEIASCEGEYFLSETISACLNIDRIPLLKQLQLLESKYNLIRHEKNLYRFNHLMVREVLYESILPELREEYHRMIGSYLIEKYSIKDDYAARIAHHLTSSNQEEKSLEYFLSAANLSRNLYATDDALDSYQKVNSIMKKLSSTDPSLIIEVEEGLGDVKQSMGNAKQALAHYTTFLELARQSSNRINEIRALRKYAEVNRVLGNIEQAFELCSEAIAISKDVKNNEELIHSLNTMAFISASKGSYDKTIQISEEALVIARQMKDSINESVSISNMGFAYWHMGNYSPAMKYFTEAINIQRAIGDNLGLGTTLNFIAMAYWKVGDYNKALDDGIESVKIKERVADYRKIPGGLNVIGDVYRSLNDLDKAIEYHTKSLAMAREHQNKGAMCDNIRDLGEDHLLLGDYKLAREKYDEVLELAKTSGILWYETRTYISLSELCLLSGDKDQAKHFAETGFNYAEKIGSKDLIIEALWKQASVLADAGSLAESAKLFKEAISEAEEVGHNTFLWMLYSDFSTLLVKQKMTKESKDEFEKSKSILQSIVEKIYNPELKSLFLKSDSVAKVLG